MDIKTYLSSLLPETRKKLLASPPVCLALFQSLDERERLATLRLLCGPIPRRILDSGASKGGQPSGLPALASLELVVASSGNFVLDAAFQEHLAQSLAGQSAKTQSSAETVANAEELLSYAKHRWEHLIQPLLKKVIGNNLFKNAEEDWMDEDPVGPVEILPARRYLKITKQAGLVDGEGRLTQVGYRFLLTDIPGQVWSLLQSFIECEVEPTKKATAIGVLIKLTTLVSGKVYTLEEFSEFERTLIVDWLPFGIVKRIDDDRFTVTPLTWQIIVSSAGTSMGRWKSGIIVESNYLIYAYTDSPVMIGLLELFSELKTRLPNMCVAYLSRKSVRRALKLGISAESILAYLRQNIHPVHLEKPKLAPEKEFLMLLGEDDLAGAGREPQTADEALLLGDPHEIGVGIPPSVSEQIQLWEQERDRLKTTEGRMWEEFDEPSHFDKLLKYAQDLDVVVWHSVPERKLFIKESAFEVVKKYYQSLKAGTAE